MTQSEALYEFYKLKPMYRGVAATESLLLTNCPRPVNVNNLLATATRMSISDKLAVSGNYIRAYRTFYANHPEIEECEAVNNILDREHHGDDITAESLEELFQVPSIRSMLPESVKNEEKRAEQAHRNELIEFISQGKATYGAWSKIHGQVRWYKTEDLLDEPTSTLEKIADILREQRELLNMTPAERREATRPPAVQPTELINEKTGLPYTRKEIVNASRAELRRIVCTSDGQIKPGAKEALERILRGQA